PVPRDPLLQPRPHHEAGRGDPWPADGRAGGRSRGCVLGEARQGADRGERLAGIRLLAAGDCAGARGDADGRGRRREPGGDRQGDGARLPAPDGAASPVGPRRARRAARHRELPVRGPRLGAVQTAGDPQAPRRRRQARPQDGPRVLHLGGMRSGMPYESLLLRIEERVATIVVNRPEKRNALNSVVRREMVEALDALQNEPEVRVVVITGAGDKAFIAGADIGEFAERTPLEQREAMEGRRVFEVIAEYPKPTIAMINGYALG